MKAKEHGLKVTLHFGEVDNIKFACLLVSLTGNEYDFTYMRKG